MREILFRGKRLDNGAWVEGYYVHLYDCKGNETHRIYPGDAETDCGDYYPEWFEVDPATIGQYTGLTDKNDTKIFEGDILLYLFEEIGAQRAAVYYSKRNHAFLLSPYGDFQYVPVDVGEIVSNVHDKPPT